MLKATLTAHRYQAKYNSYIIFLRRYLTNLTISVFQTHNLLCFLQPVLGFLCTKCLHRTYSERVNPMCWSGLGYLLKEVGPWSPQWIICSEDAYLFHFLLLAQSYLLQMNSCCLNQGHMQSQKALSEPRPSKALDKCMKIISLEDAGPRLTLNATIKCI